MEASIHTDMQTMEASIRADMKAGFQAQAAKLIESNYKELREGCAGRPKVELIARINTQGAQLRNHEDRIHALEGSRSLTRLHSKSA